MEQTTNDIRPEANAWKNFKTDMQAMWTQVQATWFWLSFPATVILLHIYFTSTAREWGKFALRLYYPETWFPL